MANPRCRSREKLAAVLFQADFVGTKNDVVAMKSGFTPPDRAGLPDHRDASGLCSVEIVRLGKE
jgi:hypothetical protein